MWYPRVMRYSKCGPEVKSKLWLRDAEENVSHKASVYFHVVLLPPPLPSSSLLRTQAKQNVRLKLSS